MKSLLVGLSALALVAATGISLMIGNVAAQSTRPYSGLPSGKSSFRKKPSLTDCLRAGWWRQPVSTR